MATKIILAGGRGFLGQALAAPLVAKGFDVVVFSRNRRSTGTAPGRIRHVPWTGRSLGPWVSELEGAYGLVNLSGVPPWRLRVEEHAARFRDAHLHPILMLGEALRRCDFPPPVWIQAAHSALYGPRDDREISEAGFVASGIPADLCVTCEQAFGKALLAGMRWAVLRFGCVLDGSLISDLLGNLPRRETPAPWMNWIHLADAVGIMSRLLEDTHLSGVYNAVSPEPVSLRDLHVWHASRARVPTAISMPGLEHFLHRRCIPARLQQAGYRFQYPDFHEAFIADLRTLAPARVA